MRMISVLIFTLLCAAPVFANGWVIDTDETFVLVDVAYFTGGKVSIRFDDVGGDIQFNPRRAASTKAHIVVKTASATSGLGLLDPVVRGRGFLNVRKFPTIEFDFTSLVQTGPSKADIFGTITLLGVTRPILFKARVVRFRPEEPDPADRIVSFNLFSRIDRREFGNTTQPGLIRAILPIRVHLSLRPAP